MKTAGNILWCLFGGFFLSCLWIFAGVLCCCTIVAIPCGVQSFKFASFVFWPFGRTVVFSNQVTHFLLNVLWIVFLGWELALASVFTGFIWCVTIIGIPFGTQCFKFARLALMPFGARVV